MFETRSPRLLLCFRKDDNIFFSSIPDRHTLHHNPNKSLSSSQPIGCYHMKFPKDVGSFSPTESVNGLICFQESGKPVVWNPSKREFLTLTKPRKNSNHITVLLGYDPIEGEHKVVCPPAKSSDVYRVLTLGSAQEEWRSVKTTHQHGCSVYTSSGRCIKGIIYYLAHSYYHRNGVGVLMSFDVRSENISMIQSPSDIDLRLLINYRGKLACFDRFNKGRMWILEDAGEHKWSSQDFLIPLCQFHNKGLSTSMVLKGVTHAGEFIFVPTMFSESSYIIYYDPVRNSCRRFELGRILRNEYGLGNDPWMFALHTFPNHIDDGQVST